MSKDPNWTQLGCGCVQLLFCWSVIPWLWSIWWGYEIYAKSSDKKG